MTIKKAMPVGRRGFTLIELLLSVAIVSIILVVVIFPFKRMNEQQALIKETDNVVSVLNHARSMALSSKGGEEHGVHIEPNQIVLFSGSTYSASDPDNVVMPLHSLVGITDINLSGGGSDVVFDKLYGTTVSNGTITVYLLASSTQVRIISINSTGIINENL